MDTQYQKKGMITMGRKIFKFIISFIIYMLPFGIVVLLVSTVKTLNKFIVNRYSGEGLQ